ncbi:methyl-accepting chemotaxis protein [Pseudomonas syringae pv. syringae]|uniref:methyl-accepting chemotaxis protein n=1 Tax=Pseudomonas syringae TaxID=317 RepID=UPI00200B608F|nr:methyl-accepting chemotaxis protein [Pseudomonas syringae]MCK9749772.1 methyl-accepting chemotaxis protein [Pseudomonas syringae pv. syringae]MCK9754041.1 methyl-accepting chemotaxis protein [Pseudomonas syringae pv. syringae]
MTFRSFNIATRSLLCFGLLAAMVAGVGIFGVSQMSQIRSQSLVIETNSVPSIVEADNLALQLARTRIEALRLLAIPDAATVASTRDKIKELNGDVVVAFGRYEKLVSSDHERQAFESLRQAYQEYVKNITQLTELVAAGKVDEARVLVQSGMAQLGARMNESTEALRKVNQDDIKAAAQTASATYSQSKSITWAAIGLALSLTLLLAWRLTTSLTRPIADAVSAARTIASGDLTQILDIRGQDEAAQLLQAMQQMQANLRDTLGHLGHSATQLASAAEEMTAVMHESAIGLQQQNSEIEMAATAVTEMSQAVDEVAGNATTTSTESRQAAETARRGQQQLGNTLSSIETLTSNVMGASERAGELAEQTRNISQVLDVIRSVAEQTNLLALNAAIEAARAGDAGRGFAVVADEVRALAHRTGESTQEIERMISSIQQGTGQTVDALLTSADQARETREQAQSASSALAAIAQSVSGIDERNLVIASAAEEQAQVAREVDLNLVRIRDLSVQTAAGAEQTRAASQQLSELAVGLNEQIRRFRV